MLFTLNVGVNNEKIHFHICLKYVGSYTEVFLNEFAIKICTENDFFFWWIIVRIVLILAYLKVKYLTWIVIYFSWIKSLILFFLPEKISKGQLDNIRHAYSHKVTDVRTGGVYSSKVNNSQNFSFLIKFNGLSGWKIFKWQFVALCIFINKSHGHIICLKNISTLRYVRRV